MGTTAAHGSHVEIVDGPPRLGPSPGDLRCLFDVAGGLTSVDAGTRAPRWTPAGAASVHLGSRGDRCSASMKWTRPNARTGGFELELQEGARAGQSAFP